MVKKILNDITNHKSFKMASGIAIGTLVALVLFTDSNKTEATVTTSDSIFVPKSQRLNSNECKDFSEQKEKHFVLTGAYLKISNAAHGKIFVNGVEWVNETCEVTFRFPNRETMTCNSVEFLQTDESFKVNLFKGDGCTSLALKVASRQQESQVVEPKVAQSGEPRKVPITADTCRKISSVSQGFQERMSERLKVAYRNVQLIRTEAGKEGYCFLYLDTPVGTKRLMLQDYMGGFYTDGNSYWAHWNGL